jgi:hypothetical protein
MAIAPLVNPSKTINSLSSAAKQLAKNPTELKYFLPWSESLVKQLFRRQICLPGVSQPGFTYQAISWLESRMSKTTSVFEWGSGSSTYYFAKYCERVISVEHDAEWARLLQDQLPENCTLNLECADDCDSDRIYSLKDGYRDKNFKRYVDCIDRYDGTFDIIVIDGRARVACGEKALSKLSPAGCIVLDNSERDRYAPLFDCYSLFEDGRSKSENRIC